MGRSRSFDTTDSKLQIRLGQDRPSFHPRFGDMPISVELLHDGKSREAILGTPCRVDERRNGTVSSLGFDFDAEKTITRVPLSLDLDLPRVS
jgi:hypothetical protein